MKKMLMPAAATSLEIQESGDDVLVHDRARAKIHVLNAAAGRVLRACDGKTTVESVAREIGRGHRDRTLAAVERILAEFSDLGLIDASARHTPQ
jgi:hypothetical protein